MSPEEVKQYIVAGGDAFGELIQKVSEALKVPAEFVLKQIVTQNYFYGIMDLICAASCVGFLVFYIALCKKMFHKDCEWDTDAKIMLTILGGAISLVLIILGADTLVAGLHRIVCPYICSAQDFMVIVRGLH